MGIFLWAIFKKKILLIVLIAFAVGMVSFKLDNIRIFSGEIEVRQVVCKGRVAENNGRYVVLDSLDIDGKERKGKMLVYGADIPKGHCLEFIANVSTNEVNIFDTYSMSRYYDHIFYTADRVQSMTVVGVEFKTIERIKDRINYSILDNMPPDEGGIAVSLLFGDMNYISDADNENMRSTGLSHIFSVSGLHVGFLVALLMYAGRKLRLKTHWRFVIVLFVLALYGVLTGFPSGVKRAGIMSLVYLLGVITRRKNDGLNTLALSVLIIVLLNPKELFDISFIMSAAAILGMVCYYKTIRRWVLRRSYKTYRKYIASSIAATISANIFLVPISFNVFNTFATYQMISNFLMLPLVTFIYTALMPVIALSFVVPSAASFNMILSYPITLLRLVTGGIAMLPLATLKVKSMGAFTVLYLATAVILSPYVRKIPLKEYKPPYLADKIKTF